MNYYLQKTAIMKSILLSLSVILISLFSVNTATAQAVKFHNTEPPTGSSSFILNGANTDFQFCVSGILYGCGNASSVTAYLVVSGTATTLCYNKGNGTGQEGGAVPGQTNFTSQSPAQTFDATNGHASFSLCTSVGGSCKGGGMDHYEVTDVDITDAYLVVNGKKVSLKGYGLF